MKRGESWAKVEGHYQQKLALEPFIDDIGRIPKCFVAKRVDKMLGMLISTANVESTGLDMLAAVDKVPPEGGVATSPSPPTPSYP